MFLRKRGDRLPTSSQSRAASVSTDEDRPRHGKQCRRCNGSDSGIEDRLTIGERRSCHRSDDNKPKPDDGQDEGRDSKH